MDESVVLEEFAEAGAAESAVGAWFFRGRGDEAGQVDFDVGFDAGAGAFETVEAQEFVGDELEVAGGLERDEFAQEGVGGLGPGAAAGRRRWSGCGMPCGLGASGCEVGRGGFFLHGGVGAFHQRN